MTLALPVSEAAEQRGEEVTERAEPPRFGEVGGVEHQSGVLLGRVGVGRAGDTELVEHCRQRPGESTAAAQDDVDEYLRKSFYDAG